MLAIFGSLEHSWASFLTVVRGAEKFFGRAAAVTETVATDVSKLAAEAAPIVGMFAGPQGLALDQLVNAAASLIAVGAHNAGEGATQGFTVQVVGQAAQNAIALANLIKSGAGPAGYPTTHNEVAALAVSTTPAPATEAPAAAIPPT